MFLHNGVLNHASSSRLARLGLRLDEGTVKQGAVSGSDDVASVRAFSDLPSSHLAALLSACRPLEDLELSVGPVQSLVGGAPCWIEVFDGCRRLS